MEGAYYASLANAYLREESQVTELYDEKYTEVMAESFRRRTLKLGHVATGGKGQRH